MTVIDFILHLTKDQHSSIRRKARNIFKEDVLSGGNDMWLAAELNINRAEIEAIATKTKFMS